MVEGHGTNEAQRAPRTHLPWYTLLEDWVEIIRAVFWEFSGVRVISEKIVPPPPNDTRRPAPTFLLWVVGIYVALFGLASSRYENAADRVELRANAVVALLASSHGREGAFPQVGKAQREGVPLQPEFAHPSTTISSLWSKYRPYEKTVTLLRDATTSTLPKKNASIQKPMIHIDLSGANLSGGDLSLANLDAAVLRGTDLSGADLSGADLSFANLTSADLSDANLFDADLSDTNLTSADLSRAILISADLSGADLSWANLSNINWRGITNIENAARVGDEVGVPARFSEWATEHGAPILNGNQYAEWNANRGAARRRGE